mmetsp:Transcript_21350/g.62229  ORF Transcript_21350/g.62229 Transcript_21350/m.62229 type:complete len:549 (+) Transcript_21350:3323-4969(+)
MIGHVLRLIVHVGLYRRDVGVHQHHLEPFLLQCLDGLSARIVEFSRLADGRTSGTEEQDLLHLGTFGCGRTDGEDDLLGFHVPLASVEEDVEHEFGIGRAARRLRMELGREVWTCLVGDPLVTAVVGVGEESLPSRLEILAVDVIAMILGGDVAISRLVVQDGLILTAISEGELLGGTASGESNELIAHANAVDGFHLLLGTSNDLLEFGDGLLVYGRISGTVGKEQTVVLVHLGSEGIIPGNDGQFGTPLDEVTDDVEFHPHVDGDDFDGIALTVHLGFLDAHLVDEVLEVDVLHRGEVGWRGIKVDVDPSHECALLADLLGEHTSVNVAEARYALLLEPVPEARRGVPVGVVMGVILNDEALGVDLGRFEILGEAVLVDFGPGGDAVVAHHGGGEGQDLPLVRWIGQTLRVSHHSCTEYNLALHTLVASEAPCGQSRPVLEVDLGEGRRSFRRIVALGAHEPGGAIPASVEDAGGGGGRGVRAGSGRRDEGRRGGPGRRGRRSEEGLEHASHVVEILILGALLHGHTTPKKNYRRPEMAGNIQSSA